MRGDSREKEVWRKLRHSRQECPAAWCGREGYERFLAAVGPIPGPGFVLRRATADGSWHWGGPPAFGGVYFEPTPAPPGPRLTPERIARRRERRAALAQARENASAE